MQAKDISFVITSSANAPEVNISLNLEFYIGFLIQYREELFEPSLDGELVGKTAPSEQVQQRDLFHDCIDGLMKNKHTWDEVKKHFKEHPKLDKKIKEVLSKEDMPLLIKVMDDDIGVLELIKNSVDALIAWNLNPRHQGEKIPSTVSITFGLTLSESGQICMTYHDNAGGFPEGFCKKFNAITANPKTLVEHLLTKKINANYKTDAGVFFGGAGIGTDILFVKLFAPNCNNSESIIKSIRKYQIQSDIDMIVDNFCPNSAFTFSNSGNSAVITIETSIEPFINKVTHAWETKEVPQNHLQKVQKEPSVVLEDEPSSVMVLPKFGNKKASITVEVPEVTSPDSPDSSGSPLAAEETLLRVLPKCGNKKASEFKSALSVTVEVPEIKNHILSRFT